MAERPAAPEAASATGVSPPPNGMRIFVQVLANTVVASVRGQACLEAITLTDVKTGEEREVPAAAMFIFIGTAPRTSMVAGFVERDAQGFILTGRDLSPDTRRPKGWTAERDPFLFETSVPGVFAAGDVRHQSVKRVASAVGEGSIAVQFTHRFLTEG